MAERTPLQIEQTRDTAPLRELVDQTPLTVESGGSLCRIERQVHATLKHYDLAKALASLRKGHGRLPESILKISRKISVNNVRTTALEDPNRFFPKTPEASVAYRPFAARSSRSI